MFVEAQFIETFKLKSASNVSPPQGKIIDICQDVFPVNMKKIHKISVTKAKICNKDHRVDTDGFPMRLSKRIIGQILHCLLDMELIHGLRI